MRPFLGFPSFTTWHKPPSGGGLVAPRLGRLRHLHPHFSYTHHHFTSSLFHAWRKYTRYYSGRWLPSLVRTQLLQPKPDPDISPRLLTSQLPSLTEPGYPWPPSKRVTSLSPFQTMTI